MSLLSEVFGHGAAEDDKAQSAAIRPALSILLPALGLSFLATIASAWLAWRDLLPEINLFVPGVVVVALVIFIVALQSRQHILRQMFLLALAAVLAATAAATTFYAGLNQSAANLSDTLGAKGELRITSDPQGTMGAALSRYSSAELTALDGRKATVRLYWGKDQTPAPLGSSMQATYDFSALRERDEWLFSQGICGTIRLLEYSPPYFARDIIGAIAAFRAERAEFLATMPGEGSAINAGMLLGDRQRLDGLEVNQDFKVAGLTHLIAVSGSHLAVIASLICWFLRRLPVARPISILVLIAVLAVYVVLTACQPSAIRSAVMAACSSLSFLSGRRAHSLSALAFAATAMIILAPCNAFSLGFWLSVFAVFGIVLFNGLIKDWLLAFFGWLNVLPSFFYRPAHAVIEMVALTLSAQVAIMPLSIPFFASFSCISPVANLLASPLMTAMVGAGIFLLCLPLSLLELCKPLVALLNGLGDLVAGIASLFAKVPGASVPLTMELTIAAVLSLVLFASVYLCWPKATVFRARLLVCSACIGLLILQLLVPQLTPPSLVVMDIGQGDAILIRDGSQTVLVDTGPSDSALLRALAREGVTRLDCVVVTHLDSDHCGALNALRGTVLVEQIAFAQGLLAAQPQHKAITTAASLVSREQLLELSQGDTFAFSSRLWLEVIWPSESTSEGGNPDSVCLLLHYDEQADGYDEASILLTGDAEGPQLQEMLTAGSLAKTRIDVLKVGHHGSNDAVRPEQLQLLAPQLALISVGSNNRYGHPTKETLDTLNVAAVPVLRTDLNGDITVDFAAGGFTVRCATISE